MPNNSIFPTMNLLSSILPLRTLAPYLISNLLNKFSSCFTISFNLRYDSLSINVVTAVFRKHTHAEMTPEESK